MVKRYPYWIVCAFVIVVFVPFLGKAYHIDEPFFLALARQILADPRHPLSFDFNWYGRDEPMRALNNTPLLFPYLLAVALKITGGSEWAMRLAFLPFDLALACGLYALARRFLARPLLPVLIVLACPAFVVGSNLLYPDKMSTALGVIALVGFLKGSRENHQGWFWGSALIAAAAMLCKYAAVVFPLTVMAYAWSQGRRSRQLAVWMSAAFLPLAVSILWDRWVGGSVLRTAWETTLWGQFGWWSRWPHRLRAFLAFLGGCGIATALWPLFALRPPPVMTTLSFASVVLLFSPVWDFGPVLGRDRYLALILAFGGLTGLVGLLSSHARRGKGWSLWVCWSASVAVLQLGVYWSVIARVIFLMIPPLVFAMAESLERRSEALRRVLQGATLAGSLIFSLFLAFVDFKYANAQRDVAREFSQGRSQRKVWFIGHWGFQYYWERVGARSLNADAGYWRQTRPGDVISMPSVNSNLLLPPPGIKMIARRRVDCAVPLRLMSGLVGQASFYSSSGGFLPYAFSREPLDIFYMFER